jgi:hypothetical protein
MLQLAAQDRDQLVSRTERFVRARELATQILHRAHELVDAPLEVGRMPAMAGQIRLERGDDVLMLAHDLFALARAALERVARRGELARLRFDHRLVLGDLVLERLAHDRELAFEVALRSLVPLEVRRERADHARLLRLDRARFRQGRAMAREIGSKVVRDLLQPLLLLFERRAFALERDDLERELADPLDRAGRRDRRRRVERRRR